MAESYIKTQFPTNNASAICKATKVVPTLSVGEHHTSWGGTYYYKIGSKVHIHIGVKNLPNVDWTANNIFTLPSGYRPSNQTAVIGLGRSMNVISSVNVFADGKISVYGDSPFSLADVEYDVF